jgi:UTP--glucose-1-phosphate uridylyltransferase
MTKIRKAVFPVGGRGTRFLPVTKNIPKEMLPVLDKPLIQYAVEEARAAGIEEFIFVTGRGKNVIQDHFDINYELNSELEKQNNAPGIKALDNITLDSGKACYVRQKMPLGLGHAIQCARHFIGNEPFAVLLADDLILSEKSSCLKQMLDVYQKGTHMVAVQAIATQETINYGIIDPKSDESPLIHAKGIIEKPAPQEAPSNKAVIGRYILDPKIFHHLTNLKSGKNNEIQLTDALAASLPETPLMGFEFEGVRFDCGSKVGLLEASLACGLKRPSMRPKIEKFLQKYIADFKES